MKIINKIAIISLLSLSLSACGLGLFDKDNTPPPSPLVSFKSEAVPHINWYTSTGHGVDKDYLKLTPALSNTAIFTADNNGVVAANDKLTGKSLWQVKTQTQISGGVAAGNGIVVVGTRDGSIIALNQLDGHIIWTEHTSTEILAAPAIGNGVVIVKAIDGKVTAYSVKDGSLLWGYSQTEPNLILRGASVPQITPNSTVVGFANGNLVNLSLHGGTLLWQKIISIPTGSFTIQRMVDIDANPLVVGKRVYVASYQGRISALELSSGQELWSNDISSYTGIAADSNRVYVTDAISHVWAFDMTSGVVAWKQTDLQSRNITAPVNFGNYIVVGDSEGYLHWLSKQDGHFIARTRVNRSGIIAAPIVSNGVLYVVTKDGHLVSYSLI